MLHQLSHWARAWFLHILKVENHTNRHLVSSGGALWTLNILNNQQLNISLLLRSLQQKDHYFSSYNWDQAKDLGIWRHYQQIILLVVAFYFLDYFCPKKNYQNNSATKCSKCERGKKSPNLWARRPGFYSWLYGLLLRWCLILNTQSFPSSTLLKGGLREGKMPSMSICWVCLRDTGDNSCKSAP